MTKSMSIERAQEQKHVLTSSMSLHFFFSSSLHVYIHQHVVRVVFFALKNKVQMSELIVICFR